MQDEIQDVLWQLLDDMGPDGLSVCKAAKEDLIKLYQELYPDEPKDELPSAIVIDHVAEECAMWEAEKET